MHTDRMSVCTRDIPLGSAKKTRQGEEDRKRRVPPLSPTESESVWCVEQCIAHNVAHSGTPHRNQHHEGGGEGGGKEKLTYQSRQGL